MSNHDYAECQDQACELCAAFSAVLGIMKNTNPLPQDVVDCLRTCAGLVCKDTRFKNLTLSTSMPTPEPDGVTADALAWEAAFEACHDAFCENIRRSRPQARQ